MSEPGNETGPREVDMFPPRLREGVAAEGFEGDSARVYGGFRIASA
jgi:hypothetical protein